MLVRCNIAQCALCQLATRGVYRKLALTNKHALPARSKETPPGPRRTWQESQVQTSPFLYAFVSEIFEVFPKFDSVEEMTYTRSREHSRVWADEY